MENKRRVRSIREDRGSFEKERENIGRERERKEIDRVRIIVREGDI